MAIRKPKIDPNGSNQTNLFDSLDCIRQVEAERYTEPEPGMMNTSSRIREQLTQALKSTIVSRLEIACRMTMLTDVEITESMINSWTAESKPDHRFPAEFIPAFCHATGNYDLLSMIARASGCLNVKSEDILLLEQARLEEQIQHLQRQKKTLRQYQEKMRGAKP